MRTIIAVLVLAACGNDDTADDASFDAGQDASDAGPQGPELLGSSIEPWDLAVDDTNVYWTTNVGNTIEVVSKAGGDQRTLVDSLSQPRALALSGSTLFFAQYGGGQIMSVPVTGGEPEEVAATGSALIRGLVVDPEYVYWTDQANGYVVRRQRNDGTTTMIASLQPGPWPLAIDSSGVVWANTTGGEIVAAVGSDWNVITTDQAQPLAIGTDGETIYWANSADGTLNSIPRIGGPVSMLLGNQGLIRDLAVVDGFVYWTDETNGTIRRANKDGSESATLASNQAGPASIVVDSTHVFWANRESGQIMRTLR